MLKETTPVDGFNIPELNEFSKRHQHLVIVTRTTTRTILDPYHLDVKTISTGTMFGREEVREQPGRCTLIGYFLYYLRD